eukprot:scaffold123976_cov41-Attheya_sp.AAC.3
MLDTTRIATTQHPKAALMLVPPTKEDAQNVVKKVEVTTTSSCVSDKSNACHKGNMAPEITPEYYPNRNPPMAAMP